MDPPSHPARIGLCVIGSRFCGRYWKCLTVIGVLKSELGESRESKNSGDREEVQEEEVSVV